MISKVKIKTDGVTASIVVDGKEIADTVTNYMVAHGTRDVPTLILTHKCYEAELEGEMEVRHLCGLPPEVTK